MVYSVHVNVGTICTRLMCVCVCEIIF